MIADKLENSALYAGLVPGMREAFEWLASVQADPPEDGRHGIDSDRVFAVVSTYATARKALKFLEGHYRYLDIQFIARGGPEAVYYCPADRTAVTEDYDPQADLVKYDSRDAHSAVVLEPGDFAVFFPGDAHMPGVCHGESAEVQKIVVKVRMPEPPA